MNRKLKRLLGLTLLGATFIFIASVLFAELAAAFPLKAADSQANTPTSGVLSFAELKTITPDDLAAGDHFGRTAIISDTLLFVGSTLNDENGPNAGAVYIFEKDSGAPNFWGQVKKLTASDGAGSEGFGLGLALDGDTLVVGAYAANFSGDQSGAVYIFEKNLGGPNNWGERTKLLHPDGATLDRFGWSVNLDGDTLAVGTVWDDTICAGNCNSGSVQIFERNEGGADNWGLVKTIVPNDLNDNDLFGRSVIVSGDTLFVSAGAPNVAFGLLGRVYVFERNEGGSNNWGQVKIITASDGAIDNRFSFNIALYEDTLVVGARNDDNEAGADSGAVYVFERNAGGANNWGETQKLLAPGGEPGDEFGDFVSIHGDTLVGSAPLEDTQGTNAGAIYVFSRDLNGLNEWVFENMLIGSQVGGNDEFGVWTSIWEDLIVASAHLGNNAGSDSGAAYLFQRGAVPPSMPGIFMPIVRHCSILYFDDFSDPNSGWPIFENEDVIFRYLNGNYQILLHNDFWWGGVYPAGSLHSDYLVTTDVRNIGNKPGTMGLLFGLTPNFSGFYTFDIDNSQNYFIWRWDGDWTLLASGNSPDLKTGSAWNTIAIERNGSSITAFANGEFVTSLNDSTFTGPLYVGLVAFSSNDANLDARFDNFKVEPIGCGLSTGNFSAGTSTGFAPSGPAWFESEIPERSQPGR